MSYVEINGVPCWKFSECAKDEPSCWCYNFRSFMRKYLVEQYGEWREFYAPNKTALRKVISGKVQRIILMED